MGSITVPTALIASSAISAGAGILGSSSAASAQEQAANEASQTQLQMFNQTQANEAPYLAGGNQGENSLLNLLGLGPQGQAGISAALTSTPGYQFQLSQGLNALTNAQSATGGVGGGNTLKAITQYGQGLASTDYQQMLANYQNLAGSGQNAAASLGGFGANAANQISSNQIGAGNAAAAGSVGSANAVTGATNSLASNFLLSSLLNGGGGVNGLGASNFSFSPNLGGGYTGLQ